ENPPKYSDKFWKKYWNDTPRVSLPDADLQKFWELALYKQAGMTPPDGVAAGLQGAWMEEYQLPPWSNDYHFNINVQLIYYPALMTNRASHFAPLWQMVKEWLPTLQESGKHFFENEKAMMLPHATDDHCGVLGGFWTGMIDHGCIAWVAQMAWLNYRYTLDEGVLRDIAWPLMNGAFEGYWSMKEDRDGKFSLPITVSPEYRGAEMNAWGRDASFQLAAWHALSQMLPQAARVLGEPLDARWQEVEAKLPPYSVHDESIALWDGLILEESHRHHSHLAGIWPFCSYEPLTAEHLPIVARSIAHWNKNGAGMWTGWCLPWASILCSRLELPDAAVAWLKWLDNFTNAGYGTRHNADFSGVAVMDTGQLARRAAGLPEHENEVMQMDATMGFLIAVCELLVQNRKDENGQSIIHVLPRLPRRWRHLSFDGIAVEGAFLLGATVENAHLREVRVTSNKGGMLRLRCKEKLIERQMVAGESIVI
ncbi:MAG: glycoside hydrolase family 95-like protein, partial [Abditibacteriaceae bacterium]